MSYSQDPNFWSEDDPRAKSTSAGRPKQQMVTPYRAEAPRLSAEDLPMPSVDAKPIYVPAPQPALPQATKSAHIRTSDDPMTNAKAAARIGHTLGFWLFLLAGVIVFAFYLSGYYGAIWLVLLELGVLALSMEGATLLAWALALAHSAGGVARHEHKTLERMNRNNNKTQAQIEIERIRSTERVANKAYDTYTAVQLEKWRMELEARKRLEE